MIVGGRAFLGWEPQQAWIIAHMRLAEIYLNQAEKDKAVKVLQEVAGLWRQADQDLPLTARLKNLIETLAAAGDSPAKESSR